MNHAVAIGGAALLAACTLGGLPAQVAPFETAAAPRGPLGTIDTLVEQRLARLGIASALPCSDAVFLRRAWLDVTGTLPRPAEARAFLADPSPGKRAALVDALLGRPEFVDYQAMKWCDLLRVKAEFPINLWPNAVQAYARWIHDSLRADLPYDRFVRALLLATGSNFRAPEANFLRAVPDKTPPGLARAAALTFLGSRLATWPRDRQEGLARCFSGVAYKNTLEWKEEIVFFDDRWAAGTKGPVTVMLPDGTVAPVTAGTDPRTLFADWLVQEPSRWLARCHCNRIWYWLFGRGLVHEPDDLRTDNPPSHPELLDWLAAEFVRAGYDSRHVFRLILNSATWQRSSIPASRDPAAAANFAHQALRRFEAEVLIDAICQITGTTEQYGSPIPEPFTIVPPGTRAIALGDGSTTSAFLELFGRPPRDTGLAAERDNRPTAEQRLHLLNSSHVRGKFENGRRPALGRGERAIDELYLTFLSRLPTTDEVERIREHARTNKLDPQQTARDVAWALLNSAEFLYRH
ncbi:MAG: DUF1553 domain-containing protein [Planctomycetota bacterium]|nr:DUF1553 domain-containing protein [Planctomycetota bacterium]